MPQQAGRASGGHGDESGVEKRLLEMRWKSGPAKPKPNYATEGSDDHIRSLPVRPTFLF